MSRIFVKNLSASSLPDFLHSFCSNLSKYRIFTYSLLKNIIFKYLSEEEKQLFISQALILLESKSEKEVEFGLKILKLCVKKSLPYSQDIPSNNQDGEISKNLQKLLLKLLENGRSEGKIIKIMVLLCNNYGIESEELEQIGEILAKKAREDELELITV